MNEPCWSEVTAVFGGTFDPPHFGHREAVAGLFAHPGVRRVVVLPAAIPPQKPGYTPTRHRAEMVRLSFAASATHPFPYPVEIDLREARGADERADRPTFTYDTLLELRREIPQLAFVIGTDQLENLPTWHRFPEVLGLCHWIVLERRPDGDGIAGRALQRFEARGLLRKEGNSWRIDGSSMRLKQVPTPARSLSSSAIREEIGRSGRPPADSLLPEVVEYLKAHRIYGTEGACDA